MRSMKALLPGAALTASLALSAYGGYGAGIGQATAGSLAHWLQVAAVAAAALALFGIGFWKSFRTTGEQPASFAADLAALERLVPTVRKHPDGLAALQDLVDVLFEACHRPDLLAKKGQMRKGDTDA